MWHVLHTPSLTRGGATLTLLSLLTACGGANSAPASTPPVSRPPASAASSSAPVSASAKPSSAVSASVSSGQSAAASAKPQSSKLPSLKVAFNGATATASPLWIADAIHAFEKHGVSVTITTMASPALTPALVNGEIDMYGTSAAPVLTADLNGKLDEVYIGNVENNNTTSLWSQPTIKTAADLKGKQVASDAPGSPTDYFVHALLTKLGLKPTDVVIRKLGGSEISVPALLAGQVQATGTVPPYAFQLEEKGYYQIASLIGDPYTGQGYVVLRRRFDDLAPALPGYLAAIRDAVQAYNEQPDLAKKVIQQWTKESDPAVLEKTYDFYRTKAPFDPSLQAKPAGFQEMLNYLAETTIPAAKDAKPEQFFDMRFVAQMAGR